jgi:hypothetical protein
MRKGRWAILIAAAALIAAAVPGSAAVPAQAKPDHETAEIPSDLLATLWHDLKDDKYFRDCMETEQPVVRPFGLNQPRRPAFVLSPCPGGNAGNELFLYIRSNTGWRQVLRTWGQSLLICAQADPPCPLPTGSERSSTDGWPDLELWVHESVDEGNQFVYRFDGNVYRPVACRHVLYDRHDDHSKPSSTPCIGGNWRASQGKRADIPPDLLATLHRDIHSDAGCRWWPPEKNYDAVRWFDLDRSQHALLVRPCPFGPANGGRLLWLYIRRGDGWHRIFKGFGYSLAVCAEADPPCPVQTGSEHRSSRTKGRPDLSLWRDGPRRGVSGRRERLQSLVCTDVKTSDPEGKLYPEPRYSPCPAGWRASEP